MAVAFTIPLDVLRPLVDRVGKVVERRNTVPILSNVVLQAEGDGRLTVIGTDLDIWAYATAVGVHVELAGDTTVPAGLLADILRKLPKGSEITIRSDEKGAELVAGKARFRLQELPAVDFPEAVHQEMPTAFDLTPEQMRRIVSDCAFAISTEETRYYLNGVYLHAEADTPRTLTAVATDGHRLSLLRTSIDDDVSAMPGVIVPRKMVTALFPLLADVAEAADTAVSIALNDARIALEAGTLRIVSKLIDGTFPDYRRVIPWNNGLVVQIPPTPLEQAVERVSTISAERGRAVTFTFDETGLTLSMRSPDAGESRDEIAIEGEPIEMTIGFNARYVLDALATFPTTTVEFALADPGSPALLRKPGDDTRLVVLMPMRV